MAARKRGRKRYRRIVFTKMNVSALLVAAVIVIIGCVTVINWRAELISTLSNDTFYEGVVVENVHLGGMTYEEALKQVKKVLKTKTDDVFIKITYDPSRYSLPGSVKVWEYDYIALVSRGNEKDLDRMFDEIVIPKLNEAYAQGRTGTMRERKRAIENLKVNGWRTSIDVNYDVLNSLTSELENIKLEVGQPPVNAKVTFDPVAVKFSYTDERLGWSLDTEKLMRQIEEQFKINHTVNISIELNEIVPQYRVEDLKKANKLISKFSTDYEHSSPNRKNNVQKSLSAFNGKILWPGETLSFNQTTGERTEANGYLPAPVIKEDKSVQDGLGGGVCQSSTTLYVAARLADLEINKRSHHSFPSSYVDEGFDATVNWPDLDLQFTNNRRLPVFIRTYYNDKFIFVEFYGEKYPQDGFVSLESEIYEVTPPPPMEVVVDNDGEYVNSPGQEYIAVKPRDGIKVRVYRVLKDENGEVVSRSVIYTDVYYPIKGKKYVHPQATPAPTVQPTPAITPDVVQ